MCSVLIYCIISILNPLAAIYVSGQNCHGWKIHWPFRFLPLCLKGELLYCLEVCKLSCFIFQCYIHVEIFLSCCLHFSSFFLISTMMSTSFCSLLGVSYIFILQHLVMYDLIEVDQQQLHFYNLNKPVLQSEIRYQMFVRVCEGALTCANSPFAASLHIQK